MGLGPTELIIILLIVIVLFGVGRISKLGGEAGIAVANFRKGMGMADDKDAADSVVRSEAAAERLESAEA